MTDNNLSYEDVLNKDILELMGASELPQEEKKRLYEKMLATIQNRVIARISDQLNDQGIEELKNILDSKDQNKFNDFFKSKKIDLPKLLLEEAMIYKTEIAQLANQK